MENTEAKDAKKAKNFMGIKVAFSFFLLVAVIWLAMSVLPDDPKTSRPVENIYRRDAQSIQDHADFMVNCMIYYKDPRTNLCYSDLAGCEPEGVPYRASLSTVATNSAVSCIDIPLGMLVIAHIK